MHTTFDLLGFSRAIEFAFSLVSGRLWELRRAG